jgi:hypothetical protein
MDFHLATPRGDLHLFSAEDGRVTRFGTDILDAYTVKAEHEIQSTVDEGAAAGDPVPQP